VSVVRSPAELEPTDRAVAIGTFDGVHRGHRAGIEATKAAGLRSTVVTFDPHPRLVLGYDVQLLTTLRRRIELIEAAGPDDILVVEFTEALSRLEPEEFVARILEPIGTKAVVAAETFRFGRGRKGDVALLRRLGLEVIDVPLVEGVSSSRIRELLADGETREAAALLGRPHELEGRQDGLVRKPLFLHVRHDLGDVTADADGITQPGDHVGIERRAGHCGVHAGPFTTTRRRDAISRLPDRARLAGGGRLPCGTAMPIE